MRQGRRLGAGALAAAIGISLAGAPGLAAAAEEKPGSVHLQCDGSPASENLGSLLGSLVVITMTVGLAGSSELPDDSKQLKGDLGADACDAAIAKDGDEGRRAQLKLAKAIHRIEASRYEDALTEARGLAGVAPKLSAEKHFQVSMALSALEIEGAAQARMGRTAEASELGLRMFEAAPYDPVTVLRAARLIELSPAMTPRHLAFWEQAGRINPTMLLQRAAVDEWVGDFASAAEDVEALLAVIDGFVDDPSIPRGSAYYAQAAVHRMLAGDLAGSERAAEKARKAIDYAVANNKSADEAARGQELLDLQAIGKQFIEGKQDAARQAFAGRSRWLAPSAPVVAELTRRLRQGAPAAQLTGALARDPDEIRKEALAGKLRGFGEDKNLSKLLMSNRRLQIENAFNGLSKPVWKTEKSPYALKRKPKDTYKGEILLMNLYGWGGDWEANTTVFTLHAALRARAAGKTHFVFNPLYRKIDSAVVRYGNLGDPDIPVRGSYEAAKVIQELSARIPEPPPKPT